MSVDVWALVEAQKAAQAQDQVKPADVDVLLGGVSVKVRFWPIGGKAWRALARKHPSDGGHDLDAMLPEYPRVYFVDGDDVQAVDEKAWAAVVAGLEAPFIEACTFAIWGLNVWEPQERLTEAGKVSRGGTRKKRS